MSTTGWLSGIGVAAVIGLAGFAGTLVWIEAVGLAMAIGTLVATLDLADLLFRVYQRSATTAARPPAGPAGRDADGRAIPAPAPRPYALIVSVHDAEPELPEFVEAMEPYRDHVWIIDDASTDCTRELLHRYGFRCVPAPRNLKKPGAIRHLLRLLPASVETVVVFDPDMSFLSSGSWSRPDLDVAVSDFQRSGAAAACPRVRVRAAGPLSLMQRLEYDLSVCLGREALGELSPNSGVSIYARAALESALSRHSLSVYAEDLETSVLLLADGQNIYLDRRLEVETAGADTLSALFSQRVGWSFGHIKVYAERLPELLRIAARRPTAAYQYLVYLGIVSILAHPVRLFAFALAALSLLNGLDALLGTGMIPDGGLTEPRVFAVLYAQYTMLALVGLVVVVPRRDQPSLLPAAFLYFPYAIFMSVPVALGFANWISLRWLGRRVFDDHYQDIEGLLRSRPAGPAPALDQGLAHG